MTMTVLQRYLLEKALHSRARERFLHSSELQRFWTAEPLSILPPVEMTDSGNRLDWLVRLDRLIQANQPVQPIIRIDHCLPVYLVTDSHRPRHFERR